MPGDGDGDGGGQGIIPCDAATDRERTCTIAVYLGSSSRVFL